jgi:hypothetical protein
MPSAAIHVLQAPVSPVGGSYYALELNTAAGTRSAPGSV